MSAKPKTASAKDNWQAVRARYTWHLRPPFSDQFDCSHWWEGKSQIEPVAALYELARRHPLVGQLRLKGGVLKSESGAIRCLWHTGLKSWPKLDPANQEFWEDAAGHIKGLDCRHELEQCDSITLSALCTVLLKHGGALKRKAKGMSHEQYNQLVALKCFRDPHLADKWEAAIVQEAVAAHRQGHFLIAVVPDMATREAELLLAKTFRRHQGILTPPHQRSRFNTKWLRLISQFENEIINRPANLKINPQTFIHYRRAMDGIHFETANYGGHPGRCQHILRARAFFVHSCLNAIAKIGEK